MGLLPCHWNYPVGREETAHIEMQITHDITEMNEITRKLSAHFMGQTVPI